MTNWLLKEHRTLATWVNQLIEAGFSITALNEWGPTAQQIAQQPALAEEIKCPMRFIMAATKPRT